MEFTDLEMSDLLNDLQDAGCSEFGMITPGKNYGFGRDLKGENDGKTVLYFTEEALRKISNHSSLSLPWSKWEEYHDWWKREGVFAPGIYEKVILHTASGLSDKDVFIYGISLSGSSSRGKMGAGFPKGVKYLDLDPEEVKKWYDIIVKNSRKDSMNKK
jgi:hypothetical protein